jgi:hypothetical protein
MVPIDIFTAVPGELPGGDAYCFAGFQRLNVDIVSRIRILLRNDVGTTFWNVSAATPSADKRIYPWLNLNDGRVYQWSFTIGKWISPRPWSWGQFVPPELNYTEAQIWAADGGDGTDPRLTLPDGSNNPNYVAPTLFTGAMWQVAHSMDGRFPLGVGEIPGSATIIPGSNPPVLGPPVTVAKNATSDSAGVSGEYQHILTQQEGGLGAHTHKFGLTNQDASGNGDDAFFSLGSLQVVPGTSMFYVTGGGSRLVSPETKADLETLPTLDATGAIPTTAAFNKMPPYAAGWWVIPTIRSWFTISG